MADKGLDFKALKNKLNGKHLLITVIGVPIMIFVCWAFLPAAASAFSTGSAENSTALRADPAAPRSSLPENVRLFFIIIILSGYDRSGFGNMYKKTLPSVNTL